MKASRSGLDSGAVAALVLIGGGPAAPDAKEGDWSGGRATLMGGNMAHRGSRSDLATVTES